jgi:hypothetical protein
MDAATELATNTRYKRQIEGADFSLDEVELQSDSFPEAAEAYQALCRAFWNDRLRADDPRVRLASAWGIVGLEPGNKDAADIIREDGTDEDNKRLEQARRRSRFAQASAGRFRRSK